MNGSMWCSQSDCTGTERASTSSSYPSSLGKVVMRERRAGRASRRRRGPSGPASRARPSLSVSTPSAARNAAAATSAAARSTARGSGTARSGVATASCSSRPATRSVRCGRVASVEAAGETGQRQRGDEQPEVAQRHVVEAGDQQQVEDDAGQPGDDDVRAQIRRGRRRAARPRSRPRPPSASPGGRCPGMMSLNGEARYCDQLVSTSKNLSTPKAIGAMVNARPQQREGLEGRVAQSRAGARQRLARRVVMGFLRRWMDGTV